MPLLSYISREKKKRTVTVYLAKLKGLSHKTFKVIFWQKWIDLNEDKNLCGVMFFTFSCITSGYS
jgi:hypothetical protein